MATGFRLAVFAALVLLAACAPRKAAQYAEPFAGATTERIFVVTERALDRTGNVFGEKRPEGLNYFRADVSIPPGHLPGRIEWPGNGKADPARHFAITDIDVFDSRPGFARAATGAIPGRETLVFVHGYNNTLSEALYRLAQIRADFDPGVPAVLFSWPSAGDPRGYIYDRDSVLYSRDALEDVLVSLQAVPGERVFLAAHSVGAQLVMEVLRQAALRGDRRFLNRISGVVLMSPDIDPDLFRRQAAAIGELPQPFLIFVSREDKALGLAGWLTGRKPRLGRIDGPAAVAGLDVQVIDFTGLGDGEGLNHSVATTSPAAISMLRGMIRQAQSGTPAFGDYMVLRAAPQ